MSTSSSPEPPAIPASPAPTADSEKGLVTFALFSEMQSGKQFRYWAPTLGQGDAFIDPFAIPHCDPMPVGMKVRMLGFPHTSTGPGARSITSWARAESWYLFCLQANRPLGHMSYRRQDKFWPSLQDIGMRSSVPEAMDSAPP